MDDTLYSSLKLKAAYRQAAYNLIAKVKGIGGSEAKNLYNHTRLALSSRCGYTPTNSLTLRELGIPWEQWKNQSIKMVDPRQFLQQDPQLETTISALSKRYQLGLLTNNNRVQTERIMGILGIRSFFQVILTVSETEKAKPNPSLCLDMACLLKVLPRECLAIGDEVGIDLIPASKTGMQTYHVVHVSDVYRLKVLLC